MKIKFVILLFLLVLFILVALMAGIPIYKSIYRKGYLHGVRSQMKHGQSDFIDELCDKFSQDLPKDTKFDYVYHTDVHSSDRFFRILKTKDSVIISCN